MREAVCRLADEVNGDIWLTRATVRQSERCRRRHHTLPSGGYHESSFAAPLLENTSSHRATYDLPHKPRPRRRKDTQWRASLIIRPSKREPRPQDRRRQQKAKPVTPWSCLHTVRERSESRPIGRIFSRSAIQKMQDRGAICFRLSCAKDRNRRQRPLGASGAGSLATRAGPKGAPTSSSLYAHAGARYQT